MYEVYQKSRIIAFDMPTLPISHILNRLGDSPAILFEIERKTTADIAANLF